MHMKYSYLVLSILHAFMPAACSQFAEISAQPSSLIFKIMLVLKLHSLCLVGSSRASGVWATTCSAQELLLAWC